MEKKIKMPEFDCDVVTCEFDLMHDGQKVDCMYHIERYIPMASAINVVQDIISNSYIGEAPNREYSGLANDCAMRYFIVSAFTDIELPDQLDDAVKTLYTTNIFESVWNYASEQVNEIISEVNRYIREIQDARRDHMKNSLIHNVLRMSDVARLGAESLSNVFSQISDMDADRIVDALQQVVERVDAVAAKSGGAKKEGE